MLLPVNNHHTHRPNETQRDALLQRLRHDAGAVAIEYVIVAIALLAIAGAIATALTDLGDSAVDEIPDSISDAGD